MGTYVTSTINIESPDKERLEQAVQAFMTWNEKEGFQCPYTDYYDYKGGFEATFSNSVSYGTLTEIEVAAARIANEHEIDIRIQSKYDDDVSTDYYGPNAAENTCHDAIDAVMEALSILRSHRAALTNIQHEETRLRHYARQLMDLTRDPGQRWLDHYTAIIAKYVRLFPPSDGQDIEAYGKAIRDHLVQRLQADPDLEDRWFDIQSYIETNRVTWDGSMNNLIYQLAHDRALELLLKGLKPPQDEAS
jgi:hypothetical protein